ncbi:MAG: S41 family peptidase [Polyangiaceae bacterium]|nr:S41 family peptidase [Polyangiaceae bacterium]
MPIFPVSPHRFRLLQAILVLVSLGPLLLPEKSNAEEPRSPAKADQSSTNPYRTLDRIGQALEVIENDYYQVSDQKTLAEDALRGMVKSLDPHSAYFSREEMRIFQGDTTGQFGGIGVEVDFVEGAVVIIAPIEGSPAARAGLAPGDTIVAIDDTPLRGKRPAALVRTMRGKPGTSLILTIRRALDQKLKDIRLTRELIAVSSVKATALRQGVLYFRIKAFQEGTHRELTKKMAKLLSERQFPDLPPAGIILDLRNNPGGLVLEAEAVANEFLSTGVIYTTRHRGTTLRLVHASSGGFWTRGRLVVLINEYSASAAELVAGALRDNDRATLVGAKSFGKGSVQTVMPLSDGAALKLTTALYYTPNGTTLQARGVTPDLLVDPGYEGGPAIRVLRESDLEGHIDPQEKIVKTEKRRGAPPTDKDLHLGVAREIPEDPLTGPDRALKVAYEVIVGKQAPAKDAPPH